MASLNARAMQENGPARSAAKGGRVGLGGGAENAAARGGAKAGLSVPAAGPAAGPTPRKAFGDRNGLLFPTPAKAAPNDQPVKKSLFQSSRKPLGLKATPAKQPQQPPPAAKGPQSELKTKPLVDDEKENLPPVEHCGCGAGGHRGEEWLETVLPRGSVHQDDVEALQASLLALDQEEESLRWRVTEEIPAEELFVDGGEAEDSPLNVSLDVPDQPAAAEDEGLAELLGDPAFLRHKLTVPFEDLF